MTTTITSDGNIVNGYGHNHNHTDKFCELLTAVKDNTLSMVDAVTNNTNRVIASTEAQSTSAVDATNRTGLANFTAIDVNSRESRALDLTNLLAIKENEKVILSEACKTRELSAAQFAAIQLEACKNTSAILAQIEKCCCENQVTTIAQSALTRDLINANTATALAAELAEVRQSNLLYSLNVKKVA